MSSVHVYVCQGFEGGGVAHEPRILVCSRLWSKRDATFSNGFLKNAKTVLIITCFKTAGLLQNVLPWAIYMHSPSLNSWKDGLR